jgi:hypothetical protein
MGWEPSMTIKNVQRVYLGAGVSGFSFDSSLASSDPAMEASAESGFIPGKSVGGPDTSKWAELEKHTLANLRRRTIGFSVEKTEL